EVATMLPYLGALGALVVADLAWPTTVAVLAGDCVVMCLPAVVLSGGWRLAGRRWIDPPVQRLYAWRTAHGGKLRRRVVGALGIFLGLSAIGDLTIRCGWVSAERGRRRRT